MLEGKYQDYVWERCWGRAGVECPTGTIKAGVRGPEVTRVKSTRLECREQEVARIIPGMEASTAVGLLCGGTFIFSHISVAQLHIFTHFCGQNGFVGSSQSQDETDQKHGDSLGLLQLSRQETLPSGTADEEEDAS